MLLLSWLALAAIFAIRGVQARAQDASGSLVKLDLVGRFISNEIMKNVTDLSYRTQLSLDHGRQKTWIREDGSFTINDVVEGQHILEVYSSQYHFEPMYISLTNSTIHLQPYHPARLPLPTQTPSLPYPIEWAALAKVEYYEPVAGVNVLGMLKSPMVLMMLFTGIMALGMPKLLQSMNLDPEEAAELARIREQAGAMQNMDWGEKLAGVLSGASTSSGAGGEKPSFGSASGSLSSGKTSAQSAAVAGRRRKGR